MSVRIFQAKPTIDKKVDVGFKQISFEVIISQILPCITGSSYGEWYVSYPVLDSRFHTTFDDE
jgi:hypothetical protein